MIVFDDVIIVLLMEYGLVLVVVMDGLLLRILGRMFV